MVLKETKIKNISEVTEPLNEEILKGDVHTVNEMRAWMHYFGYSDAISNNVTHYHGLVLSSQSYWFAKCIRES